MQRNVFMTGRKGEAKYFLYLESSPPTSGTPCGSPHPTESGARTPCKLFRPYCLDDPVDRKPALPGAVGGLPSSLPEYLPHHESWWFPPPLDLSKQDNLPFKVSYCKK